MTKYSLKTATATLGNDGLATSPGWLTIYQADPTTREYIGASMEYLVAGVGLPLCAYSDAPVLPRTDSKAVRRTDDGEAWEIVPDLRDQTAYSTESGQPIIISDIGDLPEGLTLLAPATSFDVWDGKKWVTDEVTKHANEVSEAEAERQRRIKQANEYISSKQWPGKLTLGRLSDDEKSLYNAWLDYIDALEACDISALPVTFPEAPQ